MSRSVCATITRGLILLFTPVVCLAADLSDPEMGRSEFLFGGKDGAGWTIRSGVTF